MEILDSDWTESVTILCYSYYVLINQIYTASSKSYGSCCCKLVVSAEKKKNKAYRAAMPENSVS